MILVCLAFLLGWGMFFKKISNPKIFLSLKSNCFTIAGCSSPKYAKCGPLSDFRQARRNFRNVEEDYKQHANEEDVGAGGGAGQGGN